MREFEQLLVIVDLVDGDVHHCRLRKRRRGRQAEVSRRHEEDPGLERSVDRGTRLRSDHHEQREREHRAQQGKAGLPQCGIEDPDYLAQAGSRRAVQQDHGAIAPARTRPPAGKASPRTGFRAGGRRKSPAVDWPTRGLPERALRPPRLATPPPSPASISPLSSAGYEDRKRTSGGPD
jgi:hypothetical protein